MVDLRRRVYFRQLRHQHSCLFLMHAQPRICRAALPVQIPEHFPLRLRSLLPILTIVRNRHSHHLWPQHKCTLHLIPLRLSNHSLPPLERRELRRRADFWAQHFVLRRARGRRRDRSGHLSTLWLWRHCLLHLTLAFRCP